MVVKIAINGFGRIGRVFTRIAAKDPAVEIVAVNDLALFDKKKGGVDGTWAAYLLRWDTVYGRYDLPVGLAGNALKIGGKSVQLLAEADPAKLPWKVLGVDVVVEATGVFRDPEKAGAHLKAGAKKVLITAPPRGEESAEVLQILWRVNENQYLERGKPDIVSAASCTTNSLGPVVKVLHEAFGIEHGFLTTVHGYTADQRLVDAAHSDLARARAAAANIIPTSTGAARSIPAIFPDLAGKLDGVAMRVPVPCGSVSDFVAKLKRPLPSSSSNPKQAVKEALKALNDTFREKAKGPLGEVMEVEEDPIVSSDVIARDRSCVVAVAYNMVLSKALDVVKVIAFYDNEWGYAARLLDVAKFIAS
ncbi:type I glyceraldehyde-3-phosphate dehydrogenase [Candidatus Bipolaricaulota bacterium]|nr:type I glyceraldehyde-3-phosphate dehydrogenase [Candidatus Bipolaricaulota bacterium]